MASSIQPASPTVIEERSGFSHHFLDNSFQGWQKASKKTIILSLQNI